MPNSRVAASLLICEKTLQEADGVVTAIRLVDVFFVPPQPESESTERRVLIYVVGAMKVPQNDRSEYSLALQLILPNGDNNEPKELFKGVFTSGKIPEALPGLNFAVQMSIVVRLGTHYVRLLLNGSEEARAAFTIVERKLEAAE